MAKCLITGCDLIVPDESKAVRGDLFKLDNHTYIFNACCDGHDTHWQWGAYMGHGSAIKLNPGVEYFERRGIIVFSTVDAKLNDYAVKYLGLSKVFPQTRVRLGDES